MESPEITNKRKKTRDLPNLSECHSCGFRIDSCTGNDRLHTLYSEWRIVLLCKICFLGVDSSQLCSYCFKPSSDNCFNCPQCNHIIHKSCFSDYATVAPWSFCSSSCGSQFSVCVDCWVPKLIAERRMCFRPTKRRNNKVHAFEGVVQDANFAVQKKVVAATRARDLAVKKALAARRAAEVAQNALDLLDNDVELAFRLHHAMNGSTKILNNLCFVQSPWARPTAFGYDSSINMDSSGSDGVDDVWVRPIDVELELNEGEKCCSNKSLKSFREGDGRYNQKDRRYFIQYSRRKLTDCGKPGRYLIKYSRRTTVNERYGSSRMRDRYLIKYSRRIVSEERFNGKYLIKYSRRRASDERFNGKPDRFLMKYTRRKINQKSTE